MNAIKEERTILAFKLQSKINPEHGDIRPVAEIVDGKLIELNANNFCHTNKVFVTTGYQSLIDDKFREGQIFRITVNPSTYLSENIDPYNASKYLAQGIKAERLKPSELIEILQGELPDRNNRYFENGFYPSTDYLFIRNEAEDCFGLFSWEYKEGDFGFDLELLNDKPLLKSYKLSLGQLLKAKNENFDKYTFSCLVEDRTYHFVLNIHEFLGEAEYYEYASDEEIVRYCAKLAAGLGTNIFNKAGWDSFKKIAASDERFSNGINKSRLAKLSELASEISTEQDEIRTNIEIFLSSNNGEQLVRNFIDKKRQQLLKPLREEILAEKNKDIEEKEEKISHVEQSLKEKTKELKELSADVERKRKEANQEVIIEQAVAERNEKVQQLDQAIAEKEKQFREINERFNLLSQLDEINKEIEERKVICKHYEKENNSLRDTTKKLEHECKKTEDELRTKLIELKPFVEHINGSFFVNKTEKDRSVFVEINTLAHADIFEQQQLVIETVKHNLRLKGRYFESWQVANFLISTQQSFITFLAGLPGVGKTSLARLLAEAQNCEPRLQEVSVARGWTSQKDLIGFYNPLSNRFQSSNTGLYAFIGALSSDAKKDEQAMAYVLLDEANLSPIEHYWSAFMAMADGKGERSLRFGDENLTVPSVLRFLATINYDGTTEPLSQRVVDRAPVLVMEAGALVEESDLAIEKSIDLPLSAIKMEELFGVTEIAPCFQDDEAIIFNKVRQILAHPSLEKGRPLSISQRKELVIRQYCAQASSLMRFFGCDDFKALDLAVLQHVLPQVRGSGQKFAKRLIELKQLCEEEGLKDSASYLDRMLAYGETELHSYDFFCW